MKKEYFWAIIIAAIVLVFSNAYVLSGVLQPKDGLSFLGRRVINSQDTYTYVAFIEQARQGRTLFENLYTTEPQKASLFRPSYILLGRLAALLGVSSITMYHISRIVFSILFCIVLYVFLGQFFSSYKRRLLAFTIVLTATGWGFFVGGLFSLVSDLWIPESNTFLSLQEAPHFILSQALMLLSFLFLLKGWFFSNESPPTLRSGYLLPTLRREVNPYEAENTSHSSSSSRSRFSAKGDNRNAKKQAFVYFILSFLMLIVLGFEHPYDLLICTGTTVFTATYLWFTKKVPRQPLIISTGLIILACIIGNLYQFIETLRNPILNNWAAQSSSPAPIDYLLGYGLIIVFALYGLEKYLTTRKIPQILVIVWIASTSILIYSPVFFQRRLSEGFHIPLSILATEGIIIVSVFISGFVLQKAKKIVSSIFIVVVVLSMTVGTVLGVYTDIVTISQENKDAYYYYLLTDEVRGMDFLRAKTGPQDIVLTNWFYGNILPGIAGRKVYVGHKAQTKDFDKKVAAINKFILNKNTNEAYKFLKDNSISYVYVGVNDTMLTYGFKPDTKPYLLKVYDVDGVVVYKVR